MGVKEWEKILKDGACYEVTCSECDGKRNSRECRFKRNDGRIPSLSADGLDDVARAKVKAALREAKGKKIVASFRIDGATVISGAIIDNYYAVKGYESRGPGKCIAFHPRDNRPLLYHEGWQGGHDAEATFPERHLTGHHCYYYDSSAALVPVSSEEATTPAKTPSPEDIAFVRKVAEAGECWPGKTLKEVCPRCKKINEGTGFCAVISTGDEDIRENRITAAKAWLAKYAPSDGAVEAVEPPTTTGAWIRDVQRVYACLELTEVNVAGIGDKALLRPETASYARVCERLYRRRFSI